MASRKKFTEKEELKDKPEWVDALEKRLTSVIENQIEMLLKRMEKMESKVNAKIESIQLEIKKSSERIKLVEQKTNELEVDLKEKTLDLPDKMVIMECKLLENCIRFRGLPENEKNIREEMIEILAEFLEISAEEVESKCDDIYRVNSEFARRKNLPRDVIVKLLTHNLRDSIFARHYQEPLEIAGKKIKIWRELPKVMIKQRKEYKQLVEKLRSEQIRYRWEMPRGISFMYNSKKLWIKTEEEMVEFLTVTKTKQGKDHKNGE